MEKEIPFDELVSVVALHGMTGVMPCNEAWWGSSSQCVRWDVYPKLAIVLYGESHRETGERLF